MHVDLTETAISHAQRDHDLSVARASAPRAPGRPRKGKERRDIRLGIRVEASLAAAINSTGLTGHQIMTRVLYCTQHAVTWEEAGRAMRQSPEKKRKAC